ncbi:hypothetical protein NU219Hw_g5961t1 [Hortaea werneckii]
MPHHLPRSLLLRQPNALRPFPRHILQSQFPPHHRHFTSLVRRLRSPQLFGRRSAEPLRYQSVRFRKPPYFTWRRAFTNALYAAVIYAYARFVFRFLDIEVEILDEDDLPEDQQREGREVTDDEGEDEEGPFYADEESTFIPLTWATKLPRSFYKGSDPEWQEFVKVAKDKQRHRKIQDELVQVVYTGATQHPTISRQLGGKDLKVGKYWLDISFPDGPPPEYERSGLEIGDGFIAWSQQKVSQEQQWRITRALWPTAALSSLWAAGKVLCGINFRRVKQALGLEGSDPFSPEERYRTAMQIMEKHQRAQERKQLGNPRASQTPDGGLPSGTATPGNLIGSASSAAEESSLAEPQSNDPQQQQNSSTKPDPNIKKLPYNFPTLPLPSTSLTKSTASTDLPIAMHVFSASLNKAWNPPANSSQKAEPPRGSFVVQGLVEVRGSRGRILFDVQSCYDPRQNKYVVVNAAVRGFKRWNQAPRGGP